jgi:hypothetical protein
MEWVIMLIAVGAMIYLFVVGSHKASESDAISYELWIHHIEINQKDKADEIIDAVKYASTYHNIRAELITAIMFAESKYDVEAMGDYTTDFFGSRFSSFGLCQINTAKSSELWSTFDYIAEKLKGTEVIKNHNLHVASYRDDVVRKASQGDTTCEIFKPLVNVFMGAWYLKKAYESCGIDASKRLTRDEAIKGLYRYNAGIFALESGFTKWQMSRKQYIQDFLSVLRYCGWEV